jgi:glycosyltransferase involved in cell wall biosynthesis
MNCKIFFVTENWWPAVGGLETSTDLLARSLSKRHDVQVLTRYGREAGSPYGAIKVLCLPTSSSSGYFNEALSVIGAAKRPNIIVHVLGYSYYWPEAQASFIRSVRQELQSPVVFKVPSLGHSKRYLSGPSSDLKETVNVFVALSDAIGSELNSVGVSAEKICRIPNGVNTDVPYKLELRSSRRRVTMGFTGRFTNQKRLNFLKSAFLKVPRKDRPYMEVVGKYDNTYGDGEAVRSKEGSGFHVEPPTQDVSQYLLKWDAFVSASKYEGMPNSVLEAMAHGLPLILSDIPGHRELVRRGINGALFKTQSELASHIGRFTVLAKRNDIARFGRASRRFVEEKYAIDKISARYDHLYEILLGGGIESFKIE